MFKTGIHARPALALTRALPLTPARGDAIMRAEYKTLLCELHTCAPGQTTKPCPLSPRPEPVTAPPRATLLLKDSDGTLETWDPFSRRRLVGASPSIVIWGGLLALAAIVFDWHLPLNRGTQGTCLVTTVSPSP